MTSRALLFGLCFFYAAPLLGTPLPRTIIALYNEKVHPDIWYTQIHQYAEMPLNHLGLKLEYHDIQQGLPDTKDRSDVLGVVVWFPSYTVLPHPEKYLRWAAEVIDAGKKFVFLGSPGFYLDTNPLPLKTINAFWEKLGLHDQDYWVNDTYDVELIKNTPSLFDFERPYRDVKAPYTQLKAVDDTVTVHLTARQYDDPTTDAALVATGPQGGYVAQGYAKYEIFNDKEHFRKWYINPFDFFNLAFDVSDLPKPDTTTLAGRRIYYSHIDGDGWNSVTEVESYRQERAIAAEVIYREIVLPYPDLPITVGPIVADIDPAWVGNAKSRDAAKKIFAQPHIEISSHTYTHPFFWKFFETYQPDDEAPYASKYPHGTWMGNPLWSKLKAMWEKREKFQGRDTALKTDGEKVFAADQEGYDDTKDPVKELSENYEVPRAYAKKPFNLTLEVDGAVEQINQLAPPGKRVALYQWSGDCQPFEGAIDQTRALNIPNLNGGDTRFDPEYLSYAWVRPLGRSVGQAWQVYASASNENTYTDLWHDRFYGFNQLPETIKNTGTPLRVKPVNVYYHMYSGQKLASLNALKQNLDYVRTLQVIPITTSRFARIVEGFNSTQIIPLGARTWQFSDRGAMQTIRFDRCTLSSVDFSKSQGVIGERHFHGSLYVYLDENTPEGIIALKDSSAIAEEAHAETSYLIESRWRIWHLRREKSGRLRFLAQGYGKGEMRWKVPDDGAFVITWEGGSVQANSHNQELTFVIDHDAINPEEFTIDRTTR